MGYDFSISTTMFIELIVLITIIIPLTPGGFGTYEIALAFSLNLFFNLNLDNEALPIAFFEHAIRQVYVYLTGFFILLISRIKTKQLIDNKT